MATGYPVTMLGEEAALPRQGIASVWGDEQEPSQAGLVGSASGGQHKVKSSIHYKLGMYTVYPYSPNGGC